MLAADRRSHVKIRKPDSPLYDKVSTLLRHAFPASSYEVQLIENLRLHNRDLLEWVCIHRNKVVGYIAYSNAYRGQEVCGFHLAPLAVAPDMQLQGIGSELLRFSLRQPQLRESTIFVLGDPHFYRRFGFEPCSQPRCPFTSNNRNFMSLRNSSDHSFVVGYEAEFHCAG